MSVKLTCPPFSSKVLPYESVMRNSKVLSRCFEQSV